MFLNSRQMHAQTTFFSARSQPSTVLGSNSVFLMLLLIWVLGHRLGRASRLQPCVERCCRVLAAV